MKKRTSVQVLDMRGYDPNGPDEDLPTGEAYANMIDLNDEEFDSPFAPPVPAGTYKVRVKVISKDGDNLWPSQKGLTRFLTIEFVIQQGKYKGRSITDRLNVELTDPDAPDNYKMTVAMGRARVRALLEAANGIAHDDKSPKARRIRRLGEWDDLDDLVCSIIVGIRPASADWPERNVVVDVVRDSD
jgi:hypothetical protein